MSRRKSAEQGSRIRKRKQKLIQVERRMLFNEVAGFLLPLGTLFSKDQFHGNIKWVPEELATQAMIWSWQDTKLVTDAFEKTLEICAKRGLKNMLTCRERWTATRPVKALPQVG